MSGVKIFFYILLAILGFGFLIASLVIYLLKLPEDCGKEGLPPCPAYLNGPQCASVIEKFKDPTIPKPTPLIYQIGFKYTNGIGPPFCAPVWYAFRYVKNKNGAYGPLSAWSGTKKDGGTPTPIYSGNVNPPCPPTGCDFPTGSNSCTFNTPKIALSGKLDVDVLGVKLENSYTLNVHRQVGSGFDKEGNPQGFDPKSEGDIVGFFIVVPGNETFKDLYINPKTTTSTTCC